MFRELMKKKIFPVLKITDGWCRQKGNPHPRLHRPNNGFQRTYVGSHYWGGAGGDGGFLSACISRPLFSKQEKSFSSWAPWTFSEYEYIIHLPEWFIFDIGVWRTAEWIKSITERKMRKQDSCVRQFFSFWFFLKKLSFSENLCIIKESFSDKVSAMIRTWDILTGHTEREGAAETFPARRMSLPPFELYRWTKAADTV